MNVSGVNLNLLAALDALITERSVTRAASRLRVTQSAMSNSLQRLRELYDDPLFHRVGRGIVPTPRALAIAPQLRDGLALLGATLAPGGFDPATTDRTFVLALSDYVEFVLVPPLLRRIAAVAPKIRIAVVPWGLHEIPPSLASGDVDLMIGFYGKLPPRHEEQLLFEDRYVCIVRRGHPRVGAKLTLARYLTLDHVIVSQTRDGVGSVDIALAKRGMKRHVGARVSHFLMVPRLIADTDFVAAMSRRAVEPFVKTFGLRVHPPPLPLPVGKIGQVWHSRQAADPAARWLRETIADIARTV
ncbi:MAG: LysR family transcriptional regulator [Myxococcales bacterium]|nr:LysR family transcriptional regulator [Myxococcales bacterium]